MRSGERSRSSASRTPLSSIPISSRSINGTRSSFATSSVDTPYCIGPTAPPRLPISRASALIPAGLVGSRRAAFGADARVAAPTTRSSRRSSRARYAARSASSLSPGKSPTVYEKPSSTVEDIGYVARRHACTYTTYGQTARNVNVPRFQESNLKSFVDSVQLINKVRSQ